MAPGVMGRIFSRGLLLALMLLLGACAETAYYWQSIGGHMRLMQSARPIRDWLDDVQTAPALRARLQLAQQMRRFASSQLHLPDNASYQGYADLQRRYVVWNVVAAPEFSLTLKTWCVPVAGCVAYRGYFDESAAKQLAGELQHQGWEVSVYGVPAYSTLGWMNWAGGDPLLNTFVHYGDGDLARLMFHELAHQVVYVADDTRFNESFATAVERLGTRQWLDMHGDAQAKAQYQILDQRREQFRALTRHTRLKLFEIYQRKVALSQSSKEMDAMKNAVMQEFRTDYSRLKRQWGGYSGLDNWVAQSNNASFAAQAAYDDLVPGFEALFKQVGRDWPKFYDAVRQLAKTAASERNAQLQQWAQEQTLG
jgi:predicted aminopeptidase